MSADKDIPTTPPTAESRSHLIYSRLPSISLMRPPQGKYSRAVDERCITYCTQSARGRTLQEEPWCRTLCLRQVFAHEVRRLKALYDMNAHFQATYKPTPVEATELKYPLPPEGQPKPTRAEKEAEQEMGKEAPQREPRYWEEGWYVWLSKSKYGAQEKMDLMMCDLERQADWQLYKTKTNEDFLAHTKALVEAAEKKPVGFRIAPPPPRTTPLSQPATVRERELTPPSTADPPHPPFPDVAGDSILIPLPPDHMPLRDQMNNLFVPLPKMLGIFTRSIAPDGAQRELAKRAWEKAWTDEPFILARNVWVKMWQVFKAGPPEDSDSSDRR